MVDWKAELNKMPLDWALTPVKEKRPLRPTWQSEQPLARDILLELLANGQDLPKRDGGSWHCRWTGVGLRLGTVSNNLMAIDIDGLSARVKFDELSGGVFPSTVSWTSGREGRSQLLFRVPPDYAQEVSTLKIACAPDEYLEFRWDGCQSVLPPSLHPITKQYQWLSSPDTTDILDTPNWLLEFLFEQSPPKPKPVERIQQSYHSYVSESTWTEKDWALSYLEALSPWRADDYECWLKVGMALKSADDSLFYDWDLWSSQSKSYKGTTDCERRWNSFSKAGVGLGTLYHYAKEDGWQHPFKQDNTSDSYTPFLPFPSFFPNTSSSPTPSFPPLPSVATQEVVNEMKTNQQQPSIDRVEAQLYKSLPPHLLEAETGLLSLLLTGLCKELDVMGIITDANTFYDSRHRIIFDAMLKLHKQGLPSNYISVVDVLQNEGNLKKIGGKEYLSFLTNPENNYLRGDTVEASARLLVDKWIRRELIKASLDISAFGYDQVTPLDTVLDESEKAVYRLRSLTPNRATLHVAEAATTAYDNLSNPNAIYSTGFPSLDSLLVGLESETLTVLAARSSMGKTAFSIQMLLQMATNHGKHCALFSLEMPANQLMHRLWCLISNHPYYADQGIQPLIGNRIRQHLSGIQPLTAEEQANLAKIAALSTELNISLNDSRNTTPSSIGSECRKLKSKYNNELGLVVIDYLQLFGGEGDAAETSNRLLGVTRYFYNLAQELKCPILLLAQINRGPENRNDKRPSMSDLAQSGGVEWIADNILMLYRDGYYNTDNPDDPALEVICRKARQGATGTAKMCFDKERFLVYEQPHHW